MNNKFNNSLKEEINKKLLYVLFLLYFLVLIWVILFHISGYIGLDSYYIALEKGHTIAFRFGYGRLHSFEYWKPSFWIDKIVNIILFLPMGSLFLFKSFKKHAFIKGAFFTILISLIFEITQCFSRMGSVDVLDTLFNVIGYIIGYYICTFVAKKCSAKTINYIMINLIAVFIPVIIFATISLFNNWYMFEPFFDFEKYPYILK